MNKHRLKDFVLALLYASCIGLLMHNGFVGAASFLSALFVAYAILFTTDLF